MKAVVHPTEIKDFKFLEELGSGAFSKVVKVIHKEKNQVFACKIFPKINIEGKGDLDRFQREIDTTAYICHPNVVQMHDFFWDDNNFYMIFDYCAGGELFDYIVKNERLNEPLAALIFQQIASAVAFCHSCGVAHRDLKPENVLIDEFPNVKVSDFGLCGFINEKELMKTFCGSPCYCAPETLSRIQYDGRLSDVWSLGVILFAMVTGEHPWNISNTNAMVRQILRGNYTVPSYVTPGCKSLIQRMMKVKVDERIHIEDVLKHPWLKCAAHAKVVAQQNLQVSMPEVPVQQEVPISTIHESIIKQPVQTNLGIYTPFVQGLKIPVLGNRSFSSGQFGQNGLRASVTVQNNSLKIQPQGAELAVNHRRQKSNFDLIENKRKPAGGTEKTEAPEKTIASATSAVIPTPATVPPPAPEQQN